jgi:soluble lytic murein transglycosylase
VKPLVVFLSLVSVAALAHEGTQPAAGGPGSADRQLAPTTHPTLSRDASSLWFVPTEKERQRPPAGHSDLAQAAQLYAAGEYGRALTLASRSAVTGVVKDYREYAQLYVGLSQLRLGLVAEARRTLDALRDDKPAGYAGVAAALASGEAAEAAGDHAAAVSIYERIAEERTTVSDDVLSRLGRAALAAGNRKRAAEAYLRVYYEFALTDAATAAGERLAALEDQITRTGYKADFGRASMLFGAGRYSEARAAFEGIVGQTSGEDREIAELRIAESLHFLKRHAAAIDALRPHLDRASRKAEARFFHLSAIRELGRHDEYVALTRALVDEFPDSSWSEEALNNLGTHHILNNEDELAAKVFAELFEKFPSGRRAERAAWKAGWWSYKNGDYPNTVRVFESAASAFPRSDYRPSFLYWSARSHGKLGQGEQAVERLQLVRTDYANSYYGRLASTQLARRPDALASADRPLSASRQTASAAAPRPPTEPRIRALLAAGLYDDAVNELRYAQRVWGGSPALDATIAWAYHRKGELRRGISAMRRAYPQFLTAGGEELPTEMLQVIFPLTYWDSIRKHSAAHDLDPYLIAALIAQESTFDPGIRSVANAWGLMQIVPATGRRLARTLGIRGFTTSTLTNAETNIRMGTLYFSQLVRQFGGTYFALASYNAGESRVVRWKAERPGLDEDEFIDDIPFPETQNYVKRILGTAEDYRRLYGQRGGTPIPVARPARAPASAAKATSGRKAPVTKKPPRRPAARTRR